MKTSMPPNRTPLTERVRRGFVLLLFTVCCLLPGSTAASPPAGLVGYWTFEEGTGTTTADLSGNNLSGTFDNVATWGGPYWTNSPLGAGALSFDGVNDRVSLGNPTELRLTGAMTISAWIYPRGFNTSGRIVAKQGGSGSRGWSLNVENTSGPGRSGAFMVASTASALVSVVTTTSLASNQWLHLCGVYEPGVALRIYTNGFLNNERTDSVPASQYNSSLNVTIGGRPTGSVDNPFNGLADEVRIFNRALTEAEIQALPELVQTPITFTEEPASQSVQQFRPVTFTAAIQGSPPHWFQWLSNGIPIPEATGLSYTIDAAAPDLDGLVVTFTASNLTYSATSTNAVLTVIQDTNRPTIVSVGSVDGLTLGLCFSELLDLNSASDRFNYGVNDYSMGVQSAVLQPDGRSVLLTIEPPDRLTGTFTVNVSLVRDLAGNEILQESVASGTVAGLTAADLNFPLQAGQTFTCGGADFDLTAGGADIWGTSDQGHIALKPVSGNFDLHVQVADLTPVNTTAKAGLMVRATLDADSPTLHLLANPPAPAGRGYIEPGRRTTVGGSTASWGTTYTAAVMPNVWLRLRRVGDLLTGFYSLDGSAWVQMAQAAQVMANPVYVGLAATAHNTVAPTVAQFRDFQDTVFPGVTLAVTQQPASQTAAVNAVATFTVAAEGAGAPASEQVLLQWQRDDGAGSFTDLAGANGTALSFLVAPADHGAQFRVQTYYAGVLITSDVATLTVTADTTPPAIVAVRSRGNPSQVMVVFSEAVETGTATDYFNYHLFIQATGDPLTVTGATLAGDGRTVTLTTDAILQDDVMYRLTVESIQDLAVPPNTIAAGTLADFVYSSLVGYWQFEEGSGTVTADATGSGFDGTLLNDPVWVEGTFGNWALQFDGANDVVNVGNPPEFQITGPMTLAAWVWVNSISSNGRIVTKGGAGGARGWGINVENFDAWAFQIAPNASANVTVAVTNVLLNEWVHVAGVYDPTIPTMRLYTNGVLGGEKFEADGVPTSQYNTGLAVGIGNRSVLGTPWNGRLDEVRIYTRALGDAEIAALATPPVTQPEFLQPTISGGQIHLDWTGSGRLEWAPAILGPWTEIAPVPTPPHALNLEPGENRFFRLNATP